MVDRGLGVALVHDWAPPWLEGLSLRNIRSRTINSGDEWGFLWNRASVRIGSCRLSLEVAVVALAVGRTITPKPKSVGRMRHRERPKMNPDASADQVIE